MSYCELGNERAFGAFLTQLRSTSSLRIKQRDVVKRLAGWTTSSYSRLENGEIAPRFDLLCPLYDALQQTGVQFTAQMRQCFVDLARQRIAHQRTHKDIHSDEEWTRLQCELARLDTMTTLNTKMLVPPVTTKQSFLPLQGLGLQDISPLHMPSVATSSVTQSNTVELTVEQQLGMRLLLTVHNLAPLFEADWTSDDVLEALQLILKGVKQWLHSHGVNFSNSVPPR